jgi:hypothetical protein
MRLRSSRSRSQRVKSLYDLMRRARTSPALQPGARPCSGSPIDPVGTPLIASSQEVTELEFRISPVRSHRSSLRETSEKARSWRAFSHRHTAMPVWPQVTLRVKWLSSGACLTIVMW